MPFKKSKPDITSDEDFYISTPKKKIKSYNELRAELKEADIQKQKFARNINDINEEGRKYI